MNFDSNLKVGVGDIVAHADYGVGYVREVRRAGREANVEFHIGILVLCLISELRILGSEAPRTIVVESPRPSSDPSQPSKIVSVVSTDTSLSTDIDDREAIEVTPILTTVDKETNGRRADADISGRTMLNIGPRSIVQTPVRGARSGDDQKFSSRQVIEALRLGTVPRFRINDLTLGLHHERVSAAAALDETEKSGGDVRAIIGEYGAGKTHFLEWIATEALNRGYLVSTASLDVWETPPSKPFTIYNALIKSLRYPDRNDTGTLAGLFERLATTIGVNGLRTALLNFNRSCDHCPLYGAFRSHSNYRSKGDEQRAELLLRWIAGERLPVWTLNKAKIYTEDTLRKFTTVADQYCYLINGVAWFARQAGYKGLVVLVDESEHYSLLNTTMKERADVFFQGMIYSALGDRQTRVPTCKFVHSPLCGLRHGGTRPYPFSYSPNSGLLFMFAATTSAIALDYEGWLDPTKIIRLDSRLSPGEIEELLARIYVFHRKAFEYDRTASFADTCAKLISLYENGRFNLRELIRVVTEAFDLIYTYPDYDPELED